AVPSQTRANRSLPMSFDPGCTTVSAMAVATAASTALPPLRSTASPALAASGWLVATAPRGANSGLRPAGRDTGASYCLWMLTIGPERGRQPVTAPADLDAA